jgi:hypothetical protein
MTRQEQIQQKRLQLLEVRITQRNMMSEVDRLDETALRLSQDICSLEIAWFEEEANTIREQVRKVDQ